MNAARTAPRRRRRLGREEREAEILAAAMEILSVREAATVTVDEIAEHAGVSRALVYEYFGDRTKLVDEVRTQFVTQFSKLLEDSVTVAGASARHLLVEFVGAHLSFAERGPEAYRLALQDPTGGVNWLARYFGGTPEAKLVAAAAAESLRAFVMHWAADGRVTRDRAQEMIVTFLSAALIAVRPLGVRPPANGISSAAAVDSPERGAPAADPASA